MMTEEAVAFFFMQITQRCSKQSKVDFETVTVNSWLHRDMFKSKGSGACDQNSRYVLVLSVN